MRAARDPGEAHRGADPPSDNTDRWSSLLHEQGANARTITQVLGHSSIRVTMDIYTFVRLDSQRSAFDRVGDALRDINEGDDDDGASGVPARI